MGEQAARRWFVTAERFSAAQAHAMGFVHECVAPDALDAKVDEIVAALVGQRADGGARLQKLVQDVAGRAIDADLRADTARRIADIRASDEGREGIASFLGKRAPNWLA